MAKDAMAYDATALQSISNTSKRVLKPYNHQVGGRSLILTYDDNTLCKPLVQQERRFYEDLPRELQPFTPEYKGVIQIGCHSCDGQIKLVAYPRSGIQLPDVNFNNGYSGVAGVCTCDDRDSDDDLLVKPKMTISSSVQEQSSTINPWTFQCQYRHLQRLHKTWQENHKPQDFILMENIASGLVHPSIMDLKMGNEVHSDYPNEEKYERQRAKCNASTSKTLGVRIAGIQAYKPASKEYTYRNKYYGFELTPQGFKDELLQFVHDGWQIRRDTLPAFIEKLSNLYTSIYSLDGSRFYSSSLLLIYDTNQLENKQTERTCEATHELDHSNDRQVMAGNCKVDVRMIDFGRSFHRSAKEDHKVSGPDKGYLLGIESLIKMFKEILLEYDQ